MFILARTTPQDLNVACTHARHIAHHLASLLAGSAAENDYRAIELAANAIAQIPTRLAMGGLLFLDHMRERAHLQALVSILFETNGHHSAADRFITWAYNLSNACTADDDLKVALKQLAVRCA